MAPQNANERLDRICRNCGERFGMHYGPIKGAYICNKKVFDRHYGKDEGYEPASIDRFVHNGKYKTKDGRDWDEKKNPNETFRENKIERSLAQLKAVKK